MKLYFAKYLPVEGEIKEGDWFWNPSTEEYLFASKEMLSWNFDGTGYPKSWRKVKLFLCSTDIQVGDKVMGESFKEFTIIDNELLIVCKQKNCYKIIGKISSLATWVKEGDEFDEDEIRYKCPHLDVHDDGYYTYETIKNDKGHFPRKIIAVKGPCGHFH